MSDFGNLPVGKSETLQGKMFGVEVKFKYLVLAPGVVNYKIEPYIFSYDGVPQVVLLFAEQTFPYREEAQGSPVTRGRCKDGHLGETWRWNADTHTDWVRLINMAIEPGFQWNEVDTDGKSTWYEGPSADKKHWMCRQLVSDGRDMVGFLVPQPLTIYRGDEERLLTTLLQLRRVITKGDANSHSAAGKTQITYAGLLKPGPVVVPSLDVAQLLKD